MVLAVKAAVNHSDITSQLLKLIGIRGTVIKTTWDNISQATYFHITMPIYKVIDISEDNTIVLKSELYNYNIRIDIDIISKYDLEHIVSYIYGYIKADTHIYNNVQITRYIYESGIPSPYVTISRSSAGILIFKRVSNPYEEEEIKYTLTVPPVYYPPGTKPTVYKTIPADWQTTPSPEPIYVITTDWNTAGSSNIQVTGTVMYPDVSTGRM